MTSILSYRYENVKNSWIYFVEITMSEFAQTNKYSSNKRSFVEVFNALYKAMKSISKGEVFTKYAILKLIILDPIYELSFYGGRNEI